MYGPRYGDNIFAIGCAVDLTLKGAHWPLDKRNSVLAEITATESYDDAIKVCQRYIAIKDVPAEPDAVRPAKLTPQQELPGSQNPPTPGPKG